MVSINVGRPVPWCTDCGEWPWDAECVKCGKAVCQSCQARCQYCFKLKKPWLMCKPCAGAHELSRGMTGGCRNEWLAYARDNVAVAQMREESYRKLGWWEGAWSRPSE